MPRVEFNNVSHANAWLDQMVLKKRTYVGFLTEKGELIIQPTTSTAPVTYGYVERCTEKQAMTLQARFDIPVMQCKRFEWNHDNTLKKE